MASEAHAECGHCRSDDAAAAAVPRRSRRRIGGQGALLVSGFALGQGFSFLRNGLLGHWLSPGDFGIAATITLILQMVETLSDLGADRLMVQADDGDSASLQASVHSSLIVRGVLTGLAIWLSAAPLADFFAVPQAEWAFAAAALVPILKGFMHADPRRLQRRLANGAQVAVEVVPQAIALAATLPLLTWHPAFDAVLWLAIGQAIIAVAVSHLLAERPYRLGFAWSDVKRIVGFGWPIWLSAFPLVAVYHGDRLIIGHLIGMEALAAYSVAFMVTMVPGLIAARAGTSLMLPLLAEARTEATELAARYRLMADITTALAAGYLTGFVIAGGALLPIAFGPSYGGLGAVVGALAAMWALRMMQAVPGMVLMAAGTNGPLLTAGLVRSAGLVLSFAAIWFGYGLLGAAVAAGLAEALSLLTIDASARRRFAISSLISRLPVLALFGTLAYGIADVAGPLSPLAQIGIGVLAALLAFAGCLFAFRATGTLLRASVAPRLGAFSHVAADKQAGA